MGLFLRFLIGGILKVVEVAFILLFDGTTEVIKMDGQETLFYFFKVFPLATVMFKGIKVVALFMIIVLFVWAGLKEIFAPLSEGRENMFKVAFMALMARILIIYSVSFVGALFDLGTGPFKIVEELAYEDAEVSGTVEKSSVQLATSGVSGAIGGLLLFKGAALAPGILMLFSSIIFVSFIFALVYLLQEYISRYLVIGILSIFAPLFAPLLMLSSTRNIFWSWMRTLIVSMALLSVNAMFIAILRQSLTQFLSFSAGGNSHVIVHLFMILGWAKMGREIDTMMSTLGFTTIQTGQSVGTDLLRLRAGTSFATGLSNIGSLLGNHARTTHANEQGLMLPAGSGGAGGGGGVNPAVKETLAGLQDTGSVNPNATAQAQQGQKNKDGENFLEQKQNQKKAQQQKSGEASKTTGSGKPLTNEQKKQQERERLKAAGVTHAGGGQFKDKNGNPLTKQQVRDIKRGNVKGTSIRKDSNRGARRQATEKDYRGLNTYGKVTPNGGYVPGSVRQLSAVNKQAMAKGTVGATNPKKYNANLANQMLASKESYGFDNDKTQKVGGAVSDFFKHDPRVGGLKKDSVVGGTVSPEGEMGLNIKTPDGGQAHMSFVKATKRNANFGSKNTIRGADGQEYRMSVTGSGALSAFTQTSAPEKSKSSKDLKELFGAGNVRSKQYQVKPRSVSVPLNELRQKRDYTDPNSRDVFPGKDAEHGFQANAKHFISENFKPGDRVSWKDGDGKYKSMTFGEESFDENGQLKTFAPSRIDADYLSRPEEERDLEQEGLENNEGFLMYDAAAEDYVDMRDFISNKEMLVTAPEMGNTVLSSDGDFVPIEDEFLNTRIHDSKQVPEFMGADGEWYEFAPGEYNLDDGSYNTYENKVKLSSALGEDPQPYERFVEGEQTLDVDSKGNVRFAKLQLEQGYEIGGIPVDEEGYLDLGDIRGYEATESGIEFETADGRVIEGYAISGNDFEYDQERDVAVATIGNTGEEFVLRERQDYTPFDEFKHFTPINREEGVYDFGFSHNEEHRYVAEAFCDKFGDEVFDAEDIHGIQFDIPSGRAIVLSEQGDYMLYDARKYEPTDRNDFYTSTFNGMDVIYESLGTTRADSPETLGTSMRSVPREFSSGNAKPKRPSSRNEDRFAKGKNGFSLKSPFNF